MEIVISRFPGIAPVIRGAAQGEVTPATTALDCDLAGGTIRPMAPNDTQESGHTPEIVKYLGSWESGLTNPIRWMYEDLPVLIYNDAGTWKKKVDGTEAVLGIDRPSSPTLTDMLVDEPYVSGSNLQEQTGHPSGLYIAYGTYVYYISFSIISGSDEVEGVLSNAIPASAYASPDALRYHILTRPSVIPAGVTHWNVYRSDGGDTARLIYQAEATGAGEGYDTVTDVTASSARGRFPTGRNLADDLYDMQYVVTWERDANGMIDESGPSDPVRITSTTIGTTVSRPASPPAGVTHWKIYRISNGYLPTTDFALVARVSVGTASHDDMLKNTQLGAAIATSYKTAEGVTVNYDTLQDDYDGMMGPHHGMFFGWKGGTIWWSEPGLPDVWPAFNRAEVPFEIKTAVVNGGEIAILTTGGLVRGIGVTPESFYTTMSQVNHGALSTRAWAVSEHGAFYLSHRGIIRVVGSAADNITESVLGENYFDSITTSTAFMEAFAGRVYLFHDAGTLIYDMKNAAFTTHSGIYEAAYQDTENGVLCVLNTDGDIETLAGSSSGGIPLTYETGDIVLGDPADKAVRSVELHGTGEILLTVTVDGTQVGQKTVDMDGINRERVLRIRGQNKGRAARIRVQGDGEVKEISIEVIKA